jgi:hypothetical protein
MIMDYLETVTTTPLVPNRSIPTWVITESHAIVETNCVQRPLSARIHHFLFHLATNNILLVRCWNTIIQVQLCPLGGSSKQHGDASHFHGRTTNDCHQEDASRDCGNFTSGGWGRFSSSGVEV